jgi:hypothetical protein
VGKKEEIMTRRHFAKLATCLVVTAAALCPGLAPPAQAGTPLMCHANDIGGAASLPWGDSAQAFAPVADYPSDRLVKDTLDLLTARTPVLVRLETLRRAAVYARRFEENGQPRLGEQLLSRLQGRALDAEAASKPDALAWFDAGLLAASLAEWSPRHKGENHGLAWVTRALRARPGDAEIEFAIALITRERPGTIGGHWSRATAGSQSNPLLARNLAARGKS